ANATSRKEVVWCILSPHGSGGWCLGVHPKKRLGSSIRKEPNRFFGWAFPDPRSRLSWLFPPVSGSLAAGTDERVLARSRGQPPSPLFSPLGFLYRLRARSTGLAILGRRTRPGRGRGIQLLGVLACRTRPGRGRDIRLTLVDLDGGRVVVQREDRLGHLIAVHDYHGVR